MSLETAARKVSVRPERLAAWEAEEAAPTMRQLRALANAYKRPLAVFFLPDPPRDFKVLRDFRRLPEAPAIVETPELLFEIRRAELRQDVTRELLQELDGSLPEWGFQASITDDPEALARRVREFLGVTALEQATWQPGYGAFNAWKQRIEDTGALVFQMLDVQIEEARGFSLYAPDIPVVAVNIKDALAGRVFTMLHELAHLLLRSEGICDPTNPPGHEPTEVFCNAVAGAALVPLDRLIQEPAFAEGRRGGWTDAVLQALARRFGSSEEVVLRRLLSAGHLSPEFYQQRREEYLERYARSSAPRGDGGGFAPPYTMAVASNGHAFTRLVLDAYARERITGSTLAELLGVRLKHLRRIEHAVRGAA